MFEFLNFADFSGFQKLNSNVNPLLITAFDTGERALPRIVSPFQVDDKLIAAKNASKDAKFTKIADYVLKYGSQALGLLVAAGVVGNKTDLYSGKYDSAAFLQFEQQARNNTTTNAGFALGGFSLNNPVVLIAVFVSALFAFNKFGGSDDSGKKKFKK
jgi:hypothetical protein